MYEYIRHGKITPTELARIRREVDAFRDKKFVSSITGKQAVNLSVRDSFVYFPKPKETPYIFNYLQSAIAIEYVGLNLNVTDVAEIQYVRYEPGGFFKWHQDDIYREGGRTRGLTFSINISDEQDYEGGELLVRVGENIHKLKKEAGSYIVFPSFLKHTATEIKSGAREAIVVWIYLSETERKFLKTQFGLKPE
jgi:PKHD-type hydroxylase